MAKYVCSVCGYVHEGDEAPERCPQCNVPADKFVEQAGESNNYIFGLTVDEVEALKGQYDPMTYINANPRLSRVVAALTDGTLDDGGSGMFSDLSDSLKNEDRYMVCADFAHYCDTRDRLNREYSDETRFASMRIMNIAGAGYFSSDRSVGEYAKRIWGIKK